MEPIGSRQSVGFLSHTCRHGNPLNALETCTRCFEENNMQAASITQGLQGLAVQSIPLTAAQHIAESISHMQQAQQIISKVK